MINYAVTDLVYLSHSKNSLLKEIPPGANHLANNPNWGVYSLFAGAYQFSMGQRRNPLPILWCAPHFREHPQIYTERIEHKEMGHTRRRAPIQKCLGGAKEGAWPTRNQSEQCGRINQRPVSVFGGAGDDREAKKPKSRLLVNWKAIFWRG